MTLTAWKTYLEVCRLGSLSAAAAALGYTQSAVSRQVAALERSAGVVLLERRARGVVPTAAGEAFRHHARVVVNEAARAYQSARTADSGAGAVRVAIGAIPSTAASIVPAAIRRLEDTLGGFVWTLRPALTAELETMAAAGEIDLAVVTDAPPGLARDPRLVRHPIGVDEMCVIVPAHHRAATHDRVGIDTLAADTWVEDNDGSAAMLRLHAARAGFEPRIDLAAADLMGKMAMVAAGHAVALIPGVLVPSLRRDVVPVRLTDAPRRGIYAVVPAETHATNPVVAALVEQLTAALERADPRG